MEAAPAQPYNKVHKQGTWMCLIKIWLNWRTRNEFCGKFTVFEETEGDHAGTIGGDTGGIPA